MRSVVRLYIILVALAGSLSVSAQIVIIYDMHHNGSTPENAIIIRAPNEKIGVDVEYQWLERESPGYRLEQQLLIKMGDQYFDELRTIDMRGRRKNVYFDITNFFGKR